MDPHLPYVVRRTFVTLLLLVPALLGGGACKVDNPDFCCVDNCEQHGASGPVACQAPLVCEADKFTCVDPSNGGHCDRMEDCAGLQVTPYCDLTDHQCKQCLGTMGCTPSAPVCSSTDACTSCTQETDCAGFASMQLGHCATTGANTGQCVACRDQNDCASNTPVCDANACRACKADDECSSNACDTSSGACLAVSDVIYVAVGGTGTTCSMAQPCGTFALALGQVTSTRKTIKVAAGSYLEQVPIADKSVVILGEGADLSSSAAGALFTITGTSNVTIEGLRIHDGLGSNGHGVLCMDANGNSPTVALAHVSVDNNGGTGVSASKCGIAVRRSRILRNTVGGIVVSNGTFDIENDFISGNGTTGSVAGGVSLQNITTSGLHTFQFNSVTGNVSSNAATSGVDCVLVTVTLSLGDSIVFGNVGGNGKQVSTTNCAWTYSDLGDGTTGTGNINMDPMFVNPSQDDLHVMSASPVKNAGDPSSTLKVDIDGDARTDGMPDIGADEISP